MAEEYFILKLFLIFLELISQFQALFLDLQNHQNQIIHEERLIKNLLIRIQLYLRVFWFFLIYLI